MECLHIGLHVYMMGYKEELVVGHISPCGCYGRSITMILVPLDSTFDKFSCMVNLL